MKILLLGPHPYYVDRGTPIDLDILLQALSRRGHSVDAVVYAHGEDRGYPGMTLHRVGAKAWTTGMGPGFSVRKLLLALPMFIRAWRLLRKGSHDVIHAGEDAVFIAMVLHMVHTVPYVYDMDSSLAQQMVERSPWLRPLAPVLDRFEDVAIRKSVAVAPVCNALADLARTRGAPRVVTLHDISRMRPEEIRSGGFLRRELGLDGPVLMYVGNLEAYQGIDLLLDSFALVVDRGVALDLVVAGGTPRAIGRYRRKAHGLGVGGRVHFIGPWPADRLGELLAEADILTAPRTKGVNTPMKIFPYLHSGRPVLVTDLPTHTQILTQEVAEIAPADPHGFAEAIIRLTEDPERRSRLGEAGRRFVERNHVWGAHEARVAELYSQVAGALGIREGRATGEARA